jgi:small subunit ribosomal protein S16
MARPAAREKGSVSRDPGLLWNGNVGIGVSTQFIHFIHFEQEVVRGIMAVSMRLMRFGGKKSPYYRIVVADRRSPRDGAFIEQVGTYNPRKDPVEIQFKAEKAAEWLKKGAQPTETVKKLLQRAGVPSKAAEAEKAEKA